MAVYTTIEPVEAKTRRNLPGGRGIVLRPEQEQAVSVAFRYFKKGLKHPQVPLECEDALWQDAVRPRTGEAHG